MHKDSYLRSKIPVPLVLLFLLNVFLVMALELLLLYPHPAELTETYLAGFDSTFESCAIVARDDVSTSRYYLVKLESGGYALIPTQQHGIFSGRVKILKGQIQLLPEDGEERALSVRKGVHTDSVLVWLSPLPGLEITYFSSGSGSGTATLYMAIAAVLEGLELALWQLLKPR